jgi:hypothetical protein
MAVTVATVLLSPISASAVPPKSAPPAKAQAPATDLKDYPKKPAPHVDPARWGRASALADVYTMVKLKNGLIKMTIYTGPPGMTAATMYAELKARGVPGLLNPAIPALRTVTPDTVNHLTSCKYGTAQTILCPTDTTLSHQIRWADGCCAHPQVWFVDHTGSQWPVTSSTYEWNTAHGVDSLYVWATCPGYSGQYCINVSDANYGCNLGYTGSAFTGYTTYTWNPTTYYTTAANIQLNDYQGLCAGPGGTSYNLYKNADGYRQMACHEMGHALGMGHNSSTDSCINPYIQNFSYADLPNSDDFTLIAQLYNDGNE